MLYIILYHGTYDKRWQNDSVFDDKAVAEAKLAFERLSHSSWTFSLFEVENPEEKAIEVAA